MIPSTNQRTSKKNTYQRFVVYIFGSAEYVHFFPAKFGETREQGEVQRRQNAQLFDNMLAVEIEELFSVLENTEYEPLPAAVDRFQVIGARILERSLQTLVVEVTSSRVEHSRPALLCDL